MGGPMSSNLHDFLELANLIEFEATLRHEAGIDRVDELKAMASGDLVGLGLPEDAAERVAEAAKTFVPGCLSMRDDDDGDIKSRLNALLVGGPASPGVGGRPPHPKKAPEPVVQPVVPNKAAEPAIEHAALSRAAGPTKKRPSTRPKKSAVLSEPEKAPLEALLELPAAAALSAAPSAGGGAPAGADTPRTQGSKLSAWLAAVGLEEAEPLLVESGIALLEDLQ